MMNFENKQPIGLRDREKMFLDEDKQFEDMIKTSCENISFTNQQLQKLIDKVIEETNFLFESLTPIEKQIYDLNEQNGNCKKQIIELEQKIHEQQNLIKQFYEIQVDFLKTNNIPISSEK